jgi:cardiolipin synthase (CMP-forming)
MDGCYYNYPAMSTFGHQILTQRPVSPRRSAMKYNVANLLTYFRLAVIPFFLAAFLGDWYGTAFTLFVLAGVSDLVDGYIARRFNQHSKMGAVLDPIADKLLMAATYICLMIQAVIPAWFVILMLGKDLFILSGLGYLKLRKIDFEYAPVFWSKATTLFLILIGTMALLDLAYPGASFFVSPVGDFVFGGIFVTTVLMLVTILEYLRRGLEILNRKAA